VNEHNGTYIVLEGKMVVAHFRFMDHAQTFAAAGMHRNWVWVPKHAPLPATGDMYWGEVRGLTQEG
jgi:hypothetical protein